MCIFWLLLQDPKVVHSMVYRAIRSSSAFQDEWMLPIAEDCSYWAAFFLRSTTHVCSKHNRGFKPLAWSKLCLRGKQFKSWQVNLRLAACRCYPFAWRVSLHPSDVILLIMWTYFHYQRICLEWVNDFLISNNQASRTSFILNHLSSSFTLRHHQIFLSTLCWYTSSIFLLLFCRATLSSNLYFYKPALTQYLKICLDSLSEKSRAVSQGASQKGRTELLSALLFPEMQDIALRGLLHRGVWAPNARVCKSS